MEELLRVQIHCDKIFREYERHKIWAAAVEKRLKSVQKSYNVDLRDYALQLRPIYLPLVYLWSYSPPFGRCLTMLFIFHSYALYEPLPIICHSVVTIICTAKDCSTESVLNWCVGDLVYRL